MARIDGRVRSRRTILALAAASSLVGILPSSSVAAETAYVWGNERSNQDYVPDRRFAYNPSGAAINITRPSPGQYKVQFVGLGGRGTPGGNVQVTAMEKSPILCQAENWASVGPDFLIDVRCFDLKGTPSDAVYSVLVTWERKK